MSEKDRKEDFPLDVKDKILTEVDKIVDRSTWYKLDAFYQGDIIDRRFELEDFYFKHYIREYREKIVRIFLQICLSYDCLVEDESLYPDKIDHRIEDYDYVHIEDMGIEHLAELIRGIVPCGEYSCTRFYFWEIDSVIEINSLKSIYIFTDSRDFLNLIEKLATAEGLYLFEEHYSVEDGEELNELVEKILNEGKEISTVEDSGHILN